MKDSDFLCNGYNKYHLWTFLYYHYQTDPHITGTRKERKQKAVNEYLQLLGKRKDEKMS